MRRLQLPRSSYNLITLTGAIIAGVTAVMLAFSLGIQFFQEETNPYVGIVLYMVLPPVLVVGLILIPVGMFRTKRRFVREGRELPQQWPKLDLNRRQHRNAFTVFVVGTVIFTLIGVVGAYQAYHFTESVSFCGTTCHNLMKPEFMAYQSSPHARVACVQCHVGAGADWYAKSKVSGLYQVYATLRDIYPRPIPTPIENLRPAAETCEQCHWPDKFHGSQQKRFNHYMYDDENTAWPIDLLLKTGGGIPGSGEAGGIHWHMNISAKVEYIARDHRRQDIPWVRMTNYATGEVTVYEDEDDPLTEEEIAATTPRTMDCVDCHNRPSHNYHSPDDMLDRALSTVDDPSSLPEFKATAVGLLEEDYETEAEALAAIEEQLLSFYEEEYPDVHDENIDMLKHAIAVVQSEFRSNMFPEMKVKWTAYPDNIGHMEFRGCMRCHNGTHVSDSGKRITRDCRSCHVILAQGSGDRAQWATSIDGLDFEHPEDIDEAWKEDGCYDCHEGVQP